jgi:hypothetical protein
MNKFKFDVSIVCIITLFLVFDESNGVGCCQIDSPIGRKSESIYSGTAIAQPPSPFRLQVILTALPHISLYRIGRHSS